MAEFFAARAVRLILLAGCAYAFLLPCAAANEPQRQGPKLSVAPRAAPRQRTRPPGAIRVDVKLILVPVTVTDALGATVSGLRREMFRLFENGAEQQMKYFATQDAPVSLGVVFDASQSMTGKLNQSRAAVARFVSAAMPGDEFFLLEFNDKPEILCNFTGNPERIEGTLADIRPKNRTALFDAIYIAIDQMKHARNQRKALLILSDGADNYSRYTEREMKTRIRETDVCIYSIGLLNGLINRHMGVLKYLAQETGGLFYQVGNTNDLPEAVAKINQAMRDQYLLGYSPTNPKKDGLYRKIEVRLNRSPDLLRLRVSWRAGYYAPE